MNKFVGAATLYHLFNCTPTPSGLNPDEIFASVHHSMLDIYCELLKAHAFVHTPANSVKCLKALYCWYWWH